MKSCIKSNPFLQDDCQLTWMRPEAQLQDWQIDVPWPDDPGAPWELLKWFAEIVQSALAAGKAPTHKQK